MELISAHLEKYMYKSTDISQFIKVNFKIDIDTVQCRKIKKPTVEAIQIPKFLDTGLAEP